MDTQVVRAELVQKEAELAEAIESRDEIVYEHSIELSQDALDDLSTLLSDNFDLVQYWQTQE